MERGDISILGGETSHTSVEILLFLFVLMLVVTGTGKAIPVEC
jgi:hypothetical protein